MALACKYIKAVEEILRQQCFRRMTAALPSSAEVFFHRTRYPHIVGSNNIQPSKKIRMNQEAVDA